MRIFWMRLRYFLRTVLAIAFILLTIGFFWGMNVCRFSAIDGERTFYLDSASSQGLQKRTLTLLDLPRVKGETVAFLIKKQVEEGVVWGDNAKERLAEEITQKYDAQILFCENICGVISYYAYTSHWNESVLLYGKKVNLHIAIGGEQCVVGSPIVFGGF